MQLAVIQALARYWATDYNWRRCEAHLNAYPQFITEIDGLNIHFIHVRSRHEDAMPLIVTHLVSVSDDVASHDLLLVTHPDVRRDPKVRATADFLKAGRGAARTLLTSE